MANTKITADNLAANAVTSASIADNSIGITQLNVSDGTNGQVLTTNGSGTLSFGDIPAGYTDSDVETYLDTGTSTPTFASATVSGDLTVDTSTFYVDSTNNRVGIGIGDSAYLGATLHISASQPVIRMADSDSSALISYATIEAFADGTLELATNHDDSTGDIKLTVNGNTALFVESPSGNVGIGNTTPSNNHANANRLVVGNGTAGGIANYVGTGTGWYAFSRDNANNTDAYDGGISYDGSRNLMFHSNAGGERMRIAGNNLHLNGGADCRIQLGSGGAGANSTSNNTVHIRGDNANLKFMAASGGSTVFEQNGTSRFVFGTNDWYLGAFNNSVETINFRVASNGTTKFNFYDNNTTEGCYIKHTGQPYGAKIIYGARWDDDEDWMAIDLRQSSSGGGYDCRVGIGTTSPTVPLVIQVSASQANAEMRFQSGTYGTDHFRAYANQQGRFYIQNVSTGSGVYLQHNANAWTSASDERLKENIVELDNVLPKITNLRAVKYNFISDEEDSTKIGFIAQDWQTDFSEVVNDTDPEELGINYTETIPVLLKAIQEQQTIIDDLKARIETLENA